MFANRMDRVMRPVVLGFALTALLAAAAAAQGARERLRVPVGRAEVVTSADEVRTVAIAEPKIADAAVGSARTVVVNAKAVGVTSLVVYTEGGRFKLYDVEVYTPNGDKQVLLHARVAELNDNARKELGFDWVGDVASSVRWLDGSIGGGLYTTKVSSPTIPLTIGPKTDGGLRYDKNDGSWFLSTTWRALEETGDIHTLANPTLTARSGEQARFQAGGEFPVPIASNSGNNQITITIEWKQYGVLVNCTPTVREDGSITLQVATEVSAIDNSNPLTLTGFVVPSLSTRKTSTTVEMKPGEYLVIGGLKQSEKLKSVKKVPILGSIPLLGFFFTNTRTESVNRELMVLVQPEMTTPTAGAMPEGPTPKPESGK